MKRLKLLIASCLLIGVACKESDKSHAGHILKKPGFLPNG